ncbi:MAG: GNAT family N-acetyltransferase [Geobacteraceae bacterium]|nr:GNAT family N-acetyltransferase [Geobacteraceae bacterium]
MKEIYSPIVTMKPKHIQSVVQTHLVSFPGFFLSFLGSRFLMLYYEGICEAPEGIGLVYLNASGGAAGFVAGSSNPRGFYSRLLKKDWLKFAFASIGAIIRKPTVITRVARGLIHPGGNPLGDDVAGLFSIGVLPELQGTGAGKKLVLAFFQEALNRGCKRLFLTTDRDENDAVNAFYQKLGFSIERQYETPEGRRMNEYWIDLDNKDTPNA